MEENTAGHLPHVMFTSKRWIDFKNHCEINNEEDSDGTVSVTFGGGWILNEDLQSTTLQVKRERLESTSKLDDVSERTPPTKDGDG